MSHPLPSQDAWTRAKLRYCEDLSDEEWQQYLNASLEDIVRDAQAREAKSREHSTSRAIVEKIQPLVSAIEQYGKALDVYTNAYPLVLSPLWGSIRIILLSELAREFGKYFDKLLDMLNQIGDVLPRFSVFERLFGSHAMVVEALSDVYVDIISFCADVKAIFRRGKRQLITNLKVFGKLIWKPFDEQFGQQKASFRRHVDNVEKSAGLSHMIEAATDREANREHQTQLQKYVDEERRNKIIASLTSVDPEKRQRLLRGTRYKNTNSWILTQDAYIHWKSAASSSILCIEGIPGSGKSVLVSLILDDLCATTQDEPVLTLYYFFDFTEPKSLQLDQFLGSLTQQLYLKNALPPASETAVAGYTTNGMRMAAPDQLIGLLEQVCETIVHLRLVVDGLDECDSRVSGSIVSIILGFVNNDSVSMSVLVTCRNEIENFRNMPRYNHLTMNSQSHDSDIQEYIRDGLASIHVLGSASHDKVTHLLSQKSQGMFLWVRFQLQELQEAASIDEMNKVLDTLPDDLEGIYERIVVKICRRASSRRLARKIFYWVAFAKRPLKVTEMQEAVAFDINDTIWDAEKIPFEDSIVKCCFGLVTCDQEDRTIRFAHHTAAGFLQKHAFLARLDDGNESSVIDDTFAGEYCIAYLHFTDFETTLTRPEQHVKLQTTGILGPGGPGSIPKMLGLGKPVLSITETFFKKPHRPVALDIDYAKHMKLRSKAAAGPGLEKYAMLDYVISHWTDHTKSFDKDLSPAWKLFSTLATSKTLPFEFRPWGPNRHFGPYGCQGCPRLRDPDDSAQNSQHNLASMFHWAAQEDHYGLISHLMDNSSEAFGHIYHERYTHQTLKIACERGSHRTIAFTIQHTKLTPVEGLTLLNTVCGGNEPRCVDSIVDHLKFRYPKHSIDDLLRLVNEGDLASAQMPRPVFVAADTGKAAIVSKLLALGCNPFYRGGPTFDYPIHVALRQNYMDVFEILLAHQWPKQLDYVPNYGHSTLHIAADIGNETAVQCILRRADSVMLDEFNLYGYSPLMLAAKNGHASAVTTLVKAGANVTLAKSESPLRVNVGNDDHGYTALMLAAKYNHLQVIKAMRDLIDFNDRGHGCVLYCALKFRNRALTTGVIEIGHWLCLPYHITYAREHDDSDSIADIRAILNFNDRSDQCYLYRATVSYDQLHSDCLFSLGDWGCLESHVESTFAENKAEQFKRLIMTAPPARRRRMLATLENQSNVGAVQSSAATKKIALTKVLLEAGATVRNYSELCQAIIGSDNAAGFELMRTLVSNRRIPPGMLRRILKDELDWGIRPQSTADPQIRDLLLRELKSLIESRRSTIGSAQMG